MTAESSFQAFDWLRRDVEQELSNHFNAVEAGNGVIRDQVRLAMRDSVLASGKRLRPIMTVVAAQDLGCRSPAALRAGCAVELVHTASLLLDDLPCMDDAATRRGRPAAHIRFGEDVAILAAIALLSDAYAMVATLPGIPGDTAARLVASLSEAIGLKGLVAGQYKDLHASGGGRAHDANTVNDEKTGSLFLTCLDMAATLASADSDAGRCLRAYGREIGRAFQLFDDLLDMDGDAGLMGKSTNQDAHKALAPRRLGRAATLDLINSHVTAARLSLAGLPTRAGGLHALTDHIFGNEGDAAPTRVSNANGAVMASLLAR